MDYLKDSVGGLFARLFAAAFGSALVASIYSSVDMAMVGWCQGPQGSAALAVVAPVWNVVYSCGLLTGIGGSVLFSRIKGRTGANVAKANDYFTAAIAASAILAAALWFALAFFDVPILAFFGADESLLSLARDYLRPIRAVFPCFLFVNVLAAFLRNDGAPNLALAAVVAGGVVNMVLDYVCIFTLDWGLFGAGFATAAGAAVTVAVMLAHFMRSRCSLALRRPTALAFRIRTIGAIGFSAFFIDIAMGIVTILFNHQILRLLNVDALAVYSVVITVSTLVQCCGYSVGQAAQPILSANFGARLSARIAATRRVALWYASAFALLWFAAAELAPNAFVRLFMRPTPSVLAAAPGIIRAYALSFLALPFNVFATYYFQSILKPRTAFAIATARGLVVSGALILALPALFGANALWYAMPLTELLVALCAIFSLRRSNRQSSGAAA